MSPTNTCTKLSLLVLLSCFFSVQNKPLNPDQRLRAEKECVEETNIDYGIIVDVKQTLKVSDDPKYIEFLHCYYKKQGLQNENGAINFNEIKEVLTQGGSEDGYTKLEAENILRLCQDLSVIPAEKRPHIVLKCIFENLPENNEV